MSALFISSSNIKTGIAECWWASI